MRVGWVNFNKEEERLLTRALFFGIFFGFSLGTIVSIFVILPTVPRQVPQNLLEWTRVSLLFLSSLLILGWLSSTAFAYFSYVKRRRVSAVNGFTKFALALFIALPLGLLYALPVFVIVMIPFDNFFSQWLSQGTVFSLGMLLLFPFVFLYIAIIMPDSKPRKILNRQFRKLVIKHKKTKI
jgi:hypothetical protein